MYPSTWIVWLHVGHSVLHVSVRRAAGRVQVVVDPQAVSSFIGWHRVVIQRASTLLPPATAATCVSAFFHKKVPDLAPCCLLDQVVTHTLAGISAASRRSLAALKAPLPVADAASAADAADAFMGAGPYEVLRAVAATGEVVDAVQRHFQATVQPQLLVVRLRRDRAVLWLTGRAAAAARGAPPALAL